MANKRPNIIWIFGDQHRAQALGYAGDPNLNTPNLDRLKTEGVACRGAVSGFPLCCPARGSLLTGMYPHKCVDRHQGTIPEGQATIADVFNEAGYHTAYYGKWHLAGWPEDDGRAAFHITDPDRRGNFQTWVGYENNNSQYDCWVHGGRDENAFHYRLDGFETDCLTDLFIDYLKDRSANDEDQPFFAVLSVQPPHDPYVAPEEWMRNHTPGTVKLRDNVPNIRRVTDRARTELAGYYAMIENLDWNVGRIRKTLTEQGLADDTLILFFSDHGDSHGSQGQFRKTSPFEESIRVPFIISGRQPFYGLNRGWNNAIVNMPDIAPTTLGLCGIEVPNWMQGQNFAGLRYPEIPLPDNSDSALLQCVVPTCHPESVDRAWRGVVTRDGWKYVVFENHPWLMFNLAEDPYEQANLAFNPVYASKRKELQELLATWLERTDDTFPLPLLN